MKSKTELKGKCCCCGGEFRKTELAKHLVSCQEKNNAGKKSSAGQKKIFHIMVEGRYMPEYWLLLEVKADAKLKDLDVFLRNIWLECCGHMSAFEIEGTSYGIDPYGELGFKNMNTSMDKILDVGTKFYHQYDFGSTTELTLKVISEHQVNKAGKPIELLARNNPPEINCQLCGEPATKICTECLWSDEDAFFCNKCAKTHKCDSEMFLPVVNSPRAGVCGYTG